MKVVEDPDGILQLDEVIRGENSHVTLLPQKLVPWLISQVHDSLGHNGTQKCVHMISRFFRFEAMQDQIHRYIR